MSQLVITVSGDLTQSAATCGTREAADRHRETVNQRDGSVNFQTTQQMLPEPFFDSPQVSRLTSEGGAMEATQGREEMTVVATKTWLGLSTFKELKPAHGVN